ncbi:hypothetical protein [Pseudomonas sp. C32]|uniref:hypothetical protein n=1 Tax=Pseudomonas sp. C32 TaxID=1529208 RepID=UPI00260E7F31|nr:hypothetical protein [Pseudomonas sp. C32]MDN4547052.1 hypothetical protein [Pseudomonas sp. C32]
MIEKIMPGAEKRLIEEGFIVSVLLFNVVALIPWLTFFWHSQGNDSGNDGPAAIFLLVVTAVGTLFVMPVYSLAIYLTGIINSRRRLKWMVVLPLGMVVLFCIFSSLLWAKVGVDGAYLFFFAALGYAVHTIRLLKQVVGVVKGCP